MLPRRGHARRSRVVALSIFVGIVGLIVGIVYSRHRDPTNINPRSISQDRHPAELQQKLDSDAPAVIVGMQTCARCHPKQAADLATSGHSRTLAHSSQSEFARSLEGKTFVDPERGYAYHYKFSPETGLSVSIPGKIDRQFPLQYALGSGTHAVTFLGLVPTRNAEGGLQTVGIEHRVSIFPHASRDRLHLTPGQKGRKAEHEVTHFGKVEEAASLDKCIQCHSTSGAIEKLDVMNLLENVTCESCHGPGSRHVAVAERGVEKPGHLELLPEISSPVDQVRKCGSCHRLPEMVDAELQRRENKNIVRFQPVGMQLSRCFKESGGRMTCTMCHDPHQGVSHRTADYVAACLKCHQPGQAGQSACPVSPKVDCVRCHMPAIPLFNEVAFTDHWIRVRDQRDPTSQNAAATPAPPEK